MFDSNWLLSYFLVLALGGLVVTGVRAKFPVIGPTRFPQLGTTCGALSGAEGVVWWQEDLSTYRKAAIGPPADMQMIPDVPMPAEWVGHPYLAPPVLFGHYWITGKPEVNSQRFACLDYSAARDGPLVAYRWDGETALSSEKLE
jgi:hypothetical protein